MDVDALELDDVAVPASTPFESSQKLRVHQEQARWSTGAAAALQRPAQGVALSLPDDDADRAARPLAAGGGDVGALPAASMVPSRSFVAPVVAPAPAQGSMPGVALAVVAPRVALPDVSSLTQGAPALPPRRDVTAVPSQRPPGATSAAAAAAAPLAVGASQHLLGTPRRVEAPPPPPHHAGAGAGPGPGVEDDPAVVLSVDA
jgi:hypothetical protein